jgi:hypothetical protein
MLYDFLNGKQIKELLEMYQPVYAKRIVDIFRETIRFEETEDVLMLKQEIKNEMIGISVIKILKAGKIRLFMDIVLIRINVYSTLYGIWESAFFRPLRNIMKHHKLNE